MKTAIMFLALLTALAAASERSDLEVSIGGGVWMPSLFDSDAGLTPGPAIAVSLQIPPSLGNCFIIEASYLSAGTDNENWGAVTGIPLTVGYRIYPFYRRYAGPRGIEPLLGIYGGGMILWDSPEADQDKTSTGAGIIGAELGMRINAGESTSIDIVVTPEWIGAGSALAGETGKDLSGLQITASIAF
ncbi:MAG: hypothetical protein ABFR50_04510 [Candidatus Fermentibacteria bacterium]